MGIEGNEKAHELDKKWAATMYGFIKTKTFFLHRKLVTCMLIGQCRLYRLCILCVPTNKFRAKYVSLTNTCLLMA